MAVQASILYTSSTRLPLLRDAREKRVGLMRQVPSNRVPAASVLSSAEPPLARRTPLKFIEILEQIEDSPLRISLHFRAALVARLLAVQPRAAVSGGLRRIAS